MCTLQFNFVCLVHPKRSVVFDSTAVCLLYPVVEKHSGLCFEELTVNNIASSRSEAGVSVSIH